MSKNIIYISIKSFSINLFSLLVFLKITNYKDLSLKKKIEFAFYIIGFTLLYVFLRCYLNIMTTVIILYFLQSVILKIITKVKLSNILISLIISVSFSYYLYIISGTIEFIFQKIFNNYDKIINLLITSFIELLMLLLFFKIKRFKNGFLFLQKENEYIDIAMINISAILIISYCLLTANNEITEYMYVCLIALGIFLSIMIQKSLVLCYKQNLLKKTIQEYKKEIEDKDKTINELKEEKFKISKINHEFYNRQKALETKIKEMNVETGEEIYILDRVNNLTKEYSNKLQEAKGLSKLPSTEISEIDDMFNYMQKECYKNGIEFKLQVTGNINHLINTIIPKNELETLIGDHIRDAIIAVNSSNSTYKSILAVLGIKDGTYEFCVSDTGIEFEIETLLKLGQEQITTHKDIGGSGIGFITTFETLKRCGGSLIIEEYQPEKSSYTKSITIKFDNKNEYKICSYRANEISKRNRENRIIIEEV